MHVERVLFERRERDHRKLFLVRCRKDHRRRNAGKPEPLAVIASERIRAPLVALLLSLAVSVPAAHAQISSTITVINYDSVQPNDLASISAACPTDMTALSGGALVTRDMILTSAPTIFGQPFIGYVAGFAAAPDGWYASVKNNHTRACSH